MSKPCGASDATLVVAPEAPFPLAGGGPLRTASLLHYFVRRGPVDVIVFREPGAPDPASVFPSGLCRRIDSIPLPYHSRRLPAKLVRNSGRVLRRVPPLVDRFAGFQKQLGALLAGRHYQTALMEHFWCAPYYPQVSAVSGQVILDLFDVESVLHARCAAVERWPASLFHQVFENASRKLERHWLPRFSALLAVSEVDAEQLRPLAGRCPVLVYPNTIPWVPTPAAEEEDGEVIVFPGNLEYHPNVSAVRYFSRRIWPILRARHPALKWRLVGKNPQAVEKYVRGDPRIERTGPLADAVAELARAKVVVVPVLAGSGTRLKIVEAWAAARAVVSTTLGAEGLPASDGENILLRDDPSRFADAVSALLGNAGLRARLGQAGRRTYERELTWQSAWARLEVLLEPSGAGEHRGPPLPA
jgi:polysaccharide biosynthesis protein PslH